MSGEKTEKATPKKLKELRKKGVSARSIDLPSAVSFTALFVVAPTLAGQLVAVMNADLHLAFVEAGNPDLASATSLLDQTLNDALRAVTVPVIEIIAATLLTHVAITRQRPNVAALKPKMTMFQPQQALKRMVSPQTVFDLMRNLAKLAALIGVAYSAYTSGLTRLTSQAGGMDYLFAVVGTTLTQFGQGLLAVVLVIGIADAWWSRRRFNKQAKMSKQDLRDEHKQAEGDPHVKSAIRSRQMRIARNRMISAVATADVVLANPTHIAVALKYEPGTYAPVIVAKGAGVIAQKIKEQAAQHTVPVIENKPLARALYAACRTGDVIPADLYDAVAQILAAVYAARRRTGAHR